MHRLAQIARAVIAMLSVFSLLPAPALAMNDRTYVHHLLRRFAFSASPARIDAVEAQGGDGWLEDQLHPNRIDDSALEPYLEQRPTRTNAKGELEDESIYQRRLVERQIHSERQLQEKLVLHWMEHFSVAVSKVGDWALMGRYEDAIRAQALGNFANLLLAVSKEPAMLIWLDNAGNDGSQGKPNENFARELLQLYVMGTDRLRDDGSVMRDASDRALSNYTQRDVAQLAAALSGFEVACDDDAHVKNPNTRCTVKYNRDLHLAGSKAVMGRKFADTNDPQTMKRVIDFLVRQPSTAPFQARELLQRFVTDKPSPEYVRAIANVWRDNVDAPDQIARVIRAIVHHPEFGKAYHGLIKEPDELIVGALRAIPSFEKAAKTEDGPVQRLSAICSEGDGFLYATGQQLYDPPTVFSFYRPGSKEMLLSENDLAARLAGMQNLIATDPGDAGATVAFDFDALVAQLPGDPSEAATYLLDALTDVETSQLYDGVRNALASGNDLESLRKALSLILMSPEYELN